MDILRASLEDPDEIMLVELPSWPLTVHLMWMIAATVFFLGLIFCKNKMAYPWLLMMIFCQMTTSTTLMEMLLYKSDDNEARFGNSFNNPMILCAITVALGVAAIIFAFMEILI